MGWNLLLHDLVLIAFGGLLIYLRGYSSQKGKNLATKEDIAEIEDKVESVRAGYAVVRDAIQHRHELSMAALDKRLEAHQTAYYYWREIVIKAHQSGTDSEFFKECDIWWVKHCLYLTPEAEKAFRAALRIGGVFQVLRNMAAGQKALETIMSAGDVIRRAAQLPPHRYDPQEDPMSWAKSELAAASPEG